MAKFRRRITQVEAEQFNINNRTPFGTVFIPVSIVYSVDESLYYIRDGNHRPQSWLAVNKGTDDKYEVLPFTFWKVRSGKVVGIDEWTAEEGDLYRRYCDSEKWTEGSLPYGYLENNKDGSRQAVYYDDWLVKEGEKIVVLKPAVFDATYERVSDD